MKKILFSLLSALGLSGAAYGAGMPLHKGECWSYQTRPGEESSYVVIRKIETDPKLGEIIHISVFGLKIPNAGSPTGYTEHASHLPVAGEKVRSSLSKRLDRVPPVEPDWKEGYQMWREAFDAGKAGVFTIPVSECVGAVEEAMSRGTRG